MKRIYRLAFLCLALVSVTGSRAQVLRSGYFLEGNAYRFQMNPAFQNEQNFIGLPVLSNFSLNANGNVGISNFIYPYDGNGEDAYTTFLSGTVNQRTFLNALPDISKLKLDLDMSLLSFGFKGFGGYNTFKLSLHTRAGVAIPKGFFEFAKKGFQESTYSFSDLNVNATSYASIGIGHSRTVYENLIVGINLKYLVGLAYADVNVDQLDVTMQEDHWLVQSKATARLSLPGDATFTKTRDGDIDGVDVSSYGPRAGGFGLDLGATYDMRDVYYGLFEGLRFSASVVDLGYITWNNTLVAGTKAGQLEFDGFEQMDAFDVDKSTEDQLDQLKDDAEELVKLYEKESETHTTGLGATMYLGAEYKLPFYQPVSAGLMYAHRFNGTQSWTDCRLYANWTSCNWFELSTNVGFSTYGTTFGWMMNIHPNGVSLFLGSDFMITKVTPQFIPANNLNANLSLGFNITF